jgi:hypothetical protein
VPFAEWLTLAGIILPNGMLCRVHQRSFFSVHFVKILNSVCRRDSHLSLRDNP